MTTLETVSPRPSIDIDPQSEAERALREQLATISQVFVGPARAVCPNTTAAAVIETYGKPLGEQSLSILTDMLRDQSKAVTKGDLEQCETMLIGQASALQAIFMNLSRRAALNMGEYLGASETYLRLALKAQSQCRATLETLAAIKNPAQLAFIRQANIGQAVQVNNGPAPTAARARKNESQPSKLLEASHDEGLDIRATCVSGRGRTPRETVGAVNGTKNPPRKGARGA